MSIKLITVDGNTISSALDSQLYNGLALHSSSFEYADFIISGGGYSYDNQTQYLTINKMKAVGCGRMFEITEAESVLVTAPVSGTQVYTVVFRMQPYSSENKIQTLAIPLEDTLYSDDISTGSGIYDVMYATVAVNADCSATILQLLHKSPVFKTAISDNVSFKAGDHVPIPTVEAVKNYVAHKLCGNYSDDDIHKFLGVGADKQLELVKLYGTETAGLLKLGDNGLELSFAGKMSMALLMKEMLLNTNEFLDASIDDVTGDNVFASVITLSEEYNTELYNLFECKADAGFLTTLSYTKDDVSHDLQIVYPISDDDVPPVATRSKSGNSDWGNWRTNAKTKIVDISSDFGTWSQQNDNSVERVVHVVKCGNIINGTILISGELPGSFLDINNIDTLFTISEKYRPVVEISVPNVLCVSSANEGSNVETVNALCVMDSAGDMRIGIDTQNSWNAVYVSFSYLISNSDSSVVAEDVSGFVDFETFATICNPNLVPNVLPLFSTTEKTTSTLHDTVASVSLLGNGEAIESGWKMRVTAQNSHYLYVGDIGTDESYGGSSFRYIGYRIPSGAGNHCVAFYTEVKAPASTKFKAGNYTLSFYVKATGSSNVSPLLKTAAPVYGDSVTSYGGDNYVSGVSTGSWQKVSKTFTLDADTDTLYVVLDSSSRGSTTDKSLLFADIKLEYGPIATRFNPDYSNELILKTLYEMQNGG